MIEPNTKQKEEKHSFSEWFKYISQLIGTILIFIAIWMNGWDILRLSLTGLILIIWGVSIKIDGEDSKR